MMIIECTKKLADEMKMKLEPYYLDISNPFYEWHANMYVYNRKKLVLIMNNKTRYPIFLYGLKKNDFSNFHQIVLDAIRETFIAAGISEIIVEEYIENCNNCIYTKTHNKSVLGQMNDTYKIVSMSLDKFINDEKMNLLQLNLEASRILTGPTMNYKEPRELLKSSFEDMN